MTDKSNKSIAALVIKNTGVQFSLTTKVLIHFEIENFIVISFLYRGQQNRKIT